MVGYGLPAPSKVLQSQPPSPSVPCASACQVGAPRSTPVNLNLVGNTRSLCLPVGLALPPTAGAESAQTAAVGRGLGYLLGWRTAPWPSLLLCSRSAVQLNSVVGWLPASQEHRKPTLLGFKWPFPPGLGSENEHIAPVCT